MARNPKNDPLRSESSSEPGVMAGFAEAMGLAAELVVTTLVGLGLGWLLSRWLGFPVVFLLIGTGLGGAAGFMRLYRRWKKLS
jgi:F0F1-type ATP synthase assembly protein I